MDIKRLTISPIIRGTRGFAVENPTPERARQLITERLSSNYENTKPVKLKLPKFLRGFVNPKTRVIETLKRLV